MDGTSADGPLRLIIVSVALITGLLLLAGCAQVNADVSLALCQELNVVVYDRAAARGLEDMFKADVAHATTVDYEAWRGRGLQARAFELLVLPIRDML